MNKKRFLLLILFILAGAALIFYVDAATLPREGELPTNTGLRRDNLIKFIGDLIRAALGIIGAILLVLVVYGGFLYATSTGDEKKVERGKNTLTYAIIGLIIIAGAFIFTDYVIKNVLLGE